MPNTSPKIRLAFDDGTLVLPDANKGMEPPSPFICSSAVAEERAEYETARTEFTTFLDSKNFRLGGTHGWQNFVRLSARSSDGRRATLAYRRYRKIALGTAAKLLVLEDLLKKHPDQKSFWPGRSQQHKRRREY